MTLLLSELTTPEAVEQASRSRARVYDPASGRFHKVYLGPRDRQAFEQAKAQGYFIGGVGPPRVVYHLWCRAQALPFVVVNGTVNVGTIEYAAPWPVDMAMHERLTAAPRRREGHRVVLDWRERAGDVARQVYDLLLTTKPEPEDPSWITEWWETPAN